MIISNTDYKFLNNINSCITWQQVQSQFETIADIATGYYMIKSGQESELYHQLRLEQQVTYVMVESGAQCFLKVQDGQIDNTALEYVVIVQQDAQFDMELVLHQAQSVNMKIQVYLEGDHSCANIKGIYALADSQKVNIHTYQYHKGVQSSSDLVLKGMLKDSARAEYQGLIKIDQGASGTDASQENKNIVLSKDAKVVSIPSIEVLQHDVQCCHGSAIGRFDQEQLWYLQSRGLQQKQAQQLLTRSFFQSVLDNTNHELMERVCQKMV